MRQARRARKTKETTIDLTLGIDGSGKASISTGIPFFDHMLNLMTAHGHFNLQLDAAGDIEVDGHHTVEDVGIVLGEAFLEALGDCQGIKRYGSARTPMVEALAAVDLDICHRPHFVFDVTLYNDKIGEYDNELTEEFLRAFSQASGICLHVHVPYGKNSHHIVEAIFKALGRALDIATSCDERISGVMSTKGCF